MLINVLGIETVPTIAIPKAERAIADR